MIAPQSKTPFQQMLGVHPGFENHLYSYKVGLISDHRAAEWWVAQRVEGHMHWNEREEGSDIWKENWKKEIKYWEVKYCTASKNGRGAYQITINNIAKKNEEATLIIVIDVPEFNRLFWVELPPSVWKDRVQESTGAIKLTIGQIIGQNVRKMEPLWWADYVSEVRWDKD